jgi:serine/threonine protein kinase
MPDRVGQSLGNYQLIRLPGRGGFAEVYLGEHRRLGTQAAIKVLHTHVADSEEEAFLAEARTIARLEHPHIVRIFDFDVQDGTPSLVMNYASNGTLRQRHPKGARLPVPLVLDYLKQITAALQYAHEEKVIHRDIKPENMQLGRHNELLLSDFGIALIAQSSRLLSTQEVVGTAAYMAPEQLQGKPRLASDQYSLGVVIYEWLTGDRPFHGTFVELYSQHLSVPPPSLRSKVATLSPELDQVILTALAKDPTQRFASVKAFATAFEQAISGPASPARSVQENAVPTPSDLPRDAVPYSAPASSTTVTPLGTTPVKSHQLSPTPRHVAPAHAAYSTMSTPSSVIQPQVATPTTSSKQTPPLPRSRRGISRRTVIIGLTTLVALGGGAWITRSQPPQSSQSSQEGTLSYTYHGYDKMLAVAWSPDGKRIASGGIDHTVQVWNATDGSSAFTYKGHSSSVNAVAWSPNGKWIASGSDDMTVQVWNAIDGSSAFTYSGHSNRVNAVAWSPDGTWIASGSDDTTVQVWKGP